MLYVLVCAVRSVSGALSGLISKIKLSSFAPFFFEFSRTCASDQREEVKKNLRREY